MASPSRPFQSQVMTHAVRLYHRLTATGTQWLRACQSTTLLWTQVALYPAYVALQTTRVTLRKARSITAQWRDRLGLNPSSQQLGCQLPLTSDWAIQQILAAVLPVQAAMSVGLANKADPKPVLLNRGQIWPLWPANASGESSLKPLIMAGLRELCRIVQVDRFIPAFSNTPNRSLQGMPDWALKVSPEQRPVGMRIQGLASALENRALVLVGTDNQIVDGLSVAQQAAIASFITQLMAAYGSWQRRQQRLRRLQAEPLPLPVVSSHAWWPVRIVMWLMAWVQTGTVAKTMNLFQEAGSNYRLPAPSLPLLSGQPWDSARRLRPQSLTQFITVLESQLAHRRWVQQCLHALQDLQTRLTSGDESREDRAPTITFPLELLSACKTPDLIGPFRSGYWHGAQQLWLQSRLPWLSIPTGRLVQVMSPPEPDALVPVAKFAVSDAIAFTPPIAVSTLVTEEVTTSAVITSDNNAVRDSVVATDAESWAEDWINVEVSATEYLEDPFRRLLRWLDQLLVWLEKRWQWLWHQLP
ncbi:MAG: hypothetical protein AAFX01_06750 [Cyanobacteria bacterium J06638_28]